MITNYNENMINIEEISIESHINTHYRDYSYYILSSRGIPSKYDGLIPVQRLLLLHAPEKLKGTNSLIGECIGSELYHHGDASLAGAINRLCRSFDNSYTLLDGDGFFGNGMASAAAARYTKIKMNNEVREMIKKYAPVNEYNTEGNCKFINLDVPIGLCTSVVGIAIAYRSQILPRKYEDLKKYIEGDDNASLKPYFMGFKGKISRNPNNKSAWIIASDIKYDTAKGEISVVDLPPMMRYDTFLEKMVEIMDKSQCSRMKLINNSKNCVDVKIMAKSCKQEDMEKMITEIGKISSISVSEDIVFADEDGIMRYNSIRDYLDDFKIFRNRSILKKMEWDRSEIVVDMIFNELKAEFIVFMTGSQRTNDEVKKWLEINVYKYKNSSNEHNIQRIKEKLKVILAYKITKEEADQAITNHENLTKELIQANKDIKEFEKNNKFRLTSKSRSLARTN